MNTDIEVIPCDDSYVNSKIEGCCVKQNNVSKHFRCAEEAFNFIEKEGFICEQCQEKVIFSSQWKPLCSRCHFWNRVKKDANNPEYLVFVIVKDNEEKCYQCSKLNPIVKHVSPKLLGFGGALWNIVLETGEKFSSNDVWHRGTVPEECKGLFLKATFISLVSIVL